MIRTFIIVASWLCATAAHADNFAKTALSGPETWKRYEIRGTQLGTSRKALVARGFTCGKRANQRCYKLIDKRCQKGRCEFKEDAFGQWFELNGAKAPLDYMTCATTETESALVYDIRVKISPRQLLASDSALGKALIAKYGEPTHEDEPDPSDKTGGGRMSWANPSIGSDGPTVDATCSASDDSQCTITVQDYGIMKVERSRQEELDQKRMRRSQPRTAPEL